MPLNTKQSKPGDKKVAAVTDRSVKNYEAHPFFVKKAEEARAILRRVGVPKKKD